MVPPGKPLRINFVEAGEKMALAGCRGVDVGIDYRLVRRVELYVFPRGRSLRRCGGTSSGELSPYYF